MTEGAREQGRGVGKMSTRASAWLAWALAGLSVAVFLASVVLYVRVRVLVHATTIPSTVGEAILRITAM